MRVYRTEKEIKEALKGLTIVVDSREQVNQHIIEYLDKKKIAHVKRALSVGDYSAMVGNMTLEQTVTCERKASIDELCGNLAQDRDRFEREFLRAKASGQKVFLIIENATWSDVFLQNYQSKLSPKSLIASLLAWQVRFNITIIFCKSSETGRIVHGILYYAAREALKEGRV